MAIHPIHRNVRGGKPSPYPRKTFHALRSAQLLGACVVSGVMAYFIDHLKRDSNSDGGHYPVPWTFILLLSVSVATIIALVVTIGFYNFTYLSPRYNLILNSTISLGWGLGLGLLTWSIGGSKVLRRGCTAHNWGSDAAAGVCRDYKALWAMTLCGTASTVLALLLDIHTIRKDTLGAYEKPGDEQAASLVHDMKPYKARSGGYAQPEEQVEHISPVWKAPEEDLTYHGSSVEPRRQVAGQAGYRDH